MQAKPTIVYTKTDEAPALATRSLLPMIEAFIREAGIDIEVKDISLAGRIIAAFSDLLEEGRKAPDDLAELGVMVEQPDTNIIKLPNISASVAQINAAVKELQAKGYRIPEYPEEAKDEKEGDIRARFDHVKGSAVNPVIRMGNSDRRIPEAVKQHARKHPHFMGEWSKDSKTHVASMHEGDFYGSEKAVTMGYGTRAAIELHRRDGSVQALKADLKLTEGEIINASVMNVRLLRTFIEKQIQEAKEQGLLFSLHLKATMMKVSDPIIFGHVVSVFFKELFEEFGPVFKELGVTPDLGMATILMKAEELPEETRRRIRKKIEEIYRKMPELAMVNSERGITNLHVPSDIIIDNSMPAAIKAGGKMWAPDNSLKEMKAVIPDRCYAGVYQEAIDNCREHGALDPATMGSVPNIGLMAQKAEEYGSHDKTFKVDAPGYVRIVDEYGKVLLEQEVEEGDIFRACQARDIPVQDWIRLGVERARETGNPAVFWLDPNRAHDREVLKKVKACLAEIDTDGLDIRIMEPREATRFSMDRMRQGLDTISVTGNVLRDYLTDLFPILEVATSAKMLSIVPLLNGGMMYETGSGGSAPKHVQQFLQEGHLRWDSLGEFLALQASLEHIATSGKNAKARILAETLDRANERYLENNRAPSRKVGELDNRGSHYFLILYWAEALAEQENDPGLRERFAPLAEKLRVHEERILEELNAAQGTPVDIGGYFLPDDEKADGAMRPSEALNSLMEGFLRTAL